MEGLIDISGLASLFKSKREPKLPFHTIITPSHSLTFQAQPVTPEAFCSKEKCANRPLRRGYLNRDGHIHIPIFINDLSPGNEWNARRDIQVHWVNKGRKPQPR